MPVSFSNIHPANLELSPMRVSYGGVDLGATLGNVTIAPKVTKADKKADQMGTTVIDRVVSGLNIQVTTELAEVLNKDIWKVVYPNAYEVLSGSKLLQWISKVGSHDTAFAQQLNLHPLSKADGDLTEDFNFYLAVGSEESEIVYSPTAQSKLKIVWNIYPDFTSQPARFMTYGDPAVGLTPASFTGPTYLGTGNGTLTNTAVYNGFTKTETITVTQVGVSGATHDGIFEVVGSVSGLIGVAIIPGGAPATFINFVSPQITFTLTAGTVDFVNGDAFTIPTTAASYI